MFIVLSDPAIYEFENAPPVSKEWLTDRFAKLESRTSSDGTEHWLNWVVRLPNGELAGYVQATVQMDGVAYIAYELASRFWRQSIGSDAVSALLRELKLEYNVHTFLAVLKSRNCRSLALLKSLRFHCGLPENISDVGLEPDELVVHKQEGAGASAA
jgi:RimJ/RimL family protein N-acetyltransferase